MQKNAPRSAQDANTVEVYPSSRTASIRIYRRTVPDQTPDQTSPRPATTLLYIALALFAVGVAAIAAIFITAAVSDSDPALALYLTALTAPLGLCLAIVFALRSGRRVQNR